MKLYDPCRRPAGYADSESISAAAKGLPHNSLSELATRIAVAINNVEPRFYALQLRFLRVFGDRATAKQARRLRREVNAFGSEVNHLGSLPAIAEGSSVANDLRQHPEKFLYVMWHMNCRLEEKAAEMVAAFTLSHSVVRRGTNFNCRLAVKRRRNASRQMSKRAGLSSHRRCRRTF